MNKIDLDNRTAIVTGGAQGFGLAVTKRLLASGAKVIVWDISKSAIEGAKKEIKKESKALGEKKKSKVLEEKKEIKKEARK